MAVLTIATRRAVSKQLLSEKYVEEKEFIVKNKSQSGAFVVGRMLRLCRNSEGQQTNLRNDCSLVVAKELCDAWINKNVYPLEGRVVTKKELKDYKTFRRMCKEDSKYKKIDKWVKWTTDFNNRMVTNAYNIREKSAACQQKLEQQFDVKMTSKDETFYQDN